MKTITSAALRAGAQNSCVQNAGSVFRPVSRWHLFGLIEACSKTLGLNGGDLNALRAMLSYLPLKDKAGAEIPATHEMLLICYASNASICKRANGMDESNLRRHIRKLVSLGLVSRKDSATGKRFPLKRRGVVVDAFGIDLRPAFEMARELDDMAHEIEDRAEARRMLRTETLALRKQAQDSLAQIDAATRNFLEGITNLLRRKSTTLKKITEVRDRLLEILGSAPAKAAEKDLQAAQSMPAVNPDKNDHHTKQPAPCPAACKVPAHSASEELPGNDVQIARHIESQTLNKKNKARTKSSTSGLEGSDGLLTRYPNVGAFLPGCLEDREAFYEGLRSLGISLGLRDLPYGSIVSDLGLDSLLGIFERMIERVETIAHPQQYFEKTLRTELAAG